FSRIHYLRLPLFRLPPGDSIPNNREISSSGDLPLRTAFLVSSISISSSAGGISGGGSTPRKISFSSSSSSSSSSSHSATASPRPRRQAGQEHNSSAKKRP